MAHFYIGGAPYVRNGIADQLVYSTARIKYQNTTQVASGIGFFMRYESESSGNYLKLVSNKYVNKILSRN